MSLFSRLFRRKTRAPATQAPPFRDDEPALEPLDHDPARPHSMVSPPPSPHAPAVELRSDVEAVFGEDEEGIDELDDEAADPTLGRYEPLEISIPGSDEVLVARTAAERIALAGPHRITPNDPAGPGSLVETLVRLEAAGRLTSRVVDDPGQGFAILYEPTLPT